MQRSTIVFIIALFILNILIQSVVNIFIYKDHSHQQLLTTINKSNNSLENNADLLTLLTEINNKLDIQNQYLAINPDTNLQGQQKQVLTDKPPHIAPLNAKTVADYKTSLMNDISRYDMTLLSFLSDPRLSSLPEADKNEVLSEMARRLDSGEIDRSRFLPGYKP